MTDKTIVPITLELKHSDDMPSDKELHVLYPEVEAMAKIMREQLWHNRARGGRPGWIAQSCWTHWNELNWHGAKLSIAMKAANRGLIRQYASDCANIVMFLLDREGLLKQPE